MFWKKEVFEYDILIPPIEKAFSKMSPKEAETFFRWYVAQIPDRIAYLSRYTGISLDYSPRSLQKLWKWFLKTARIEKTPPAKLKELYAQASAVDKNLADIVVKDSKYQLSLQTEYIIRDIAMYVGEMFCQNFESIHWSYHTNTKKDSFANIPLLKGFVDHRFSPPFPMEFEPVHMVQVQASRLLCKDAHSMDMLNVYNNWTQWA